MAARSKMAIKVLSTGVELDGVALMELEIRA